MPGKPAAVGEFYRGYLADQLGVKLNPPSPSLVVTIRRAGRRRQPKPVIWCHPWGPTADGGRPILFYPDGDDIYNKLCSIVHRFGSDLTPATTRRAADFLEFCGHFLVRQLTPATLGDTTFATWATNSNYPSHRVEYMRKLATELRCLGPADFRCQAFIKHEGYDEPKAPRAINSPSDESKSVLGRAFRLFDAVLFSNPHFVKKVPVSERGGLLASTFRDEPITCTDYSSFEVHHRGALGAVGELWVQHVASSTLGCGDWLSIFRRIHRTHLTADFRGISCTVEGTLASGAVWTSSANGALNLCLTAYLRTTTDHPTEEPGSRARRADGIRFLIEGDDGVCEGDGFDSTIINELGAKLKRSVVHSPFDASFCGILSAGGGTNITDPLRALLKLAAMPARYGACRRAKQDAMLRAKALSYLWQYRACPILAPVCFALLQWTRGTDIRHIITELSPYERDVATQADVASRETGFHKQRPVIPIENRYAVEKHFGLSVEYQLLAEERVAGSIEHSQICLPWHPRLQVFQDHAATHLADEKRDEQRGPPAEEYTSSWLSASPPTTATSLHDRECTYNPSTGLACKPERLSRDELVNPGWSDTTVGCP